MKMNKTAREIVKNVSRLPYDQRGLVVNALAAGAGYSQTRPDPAALATSHPMEFAGQSEELQANRKLEVPCLGDLRGRVSDHSGLYGSAAWRERWQPVSEIHCYILGCKGTGDLARALGLSIWKVGTTGIGEFDRRVGDLGRQCYGSFRLGPDRYIEEAGFDRWRSPERLQLGPRHSHCPVRPSSGSLIVRLPASLSHDRFEAALKWQLTRFGLHHLADSDAGRALCADRDIDPSRLLRFSRRSAYEPFVAATELVLIRPRADTPMLAALAEAIVVTHVLGPAAG